MDQKNLALEAIRKKLVGKTLTYKEIYAIMDEIAENRLGDVLTTYFVASGFSKGFSKEEIYFLTKAMVETGEKLDFGGIVADKHSIGGVPGTRVTLIIIPIIAAAGFKIPKSSSRAITTPAGTADCMEVFAKVTFDKREILKIIEKTNACIVWGGSFKIAPADDELIKVEEPLLFESYDKILVSVMAKKVAFGSTHVVIDLPYGKTVKLHREADAQVLKEKFMYLAKKFDMKMHAYIHKVDEPAGRGIGPLLEAKDALEVLEQKEGRPMHLEKIALEIASLLLDLCLDDAPKSQQEEIKKLYKDTHEWAHDLLKKGRALEKFLDIVEAQRGNRAVTSGKLKPSEFHKIVLAEKAGEITAVNNKNVTLAAKLLGAPLDKKSGVYLQKRIGDKVERGDELFTLYGESRYNVKETFDTLDLFPIYEINHKS